MSHSSLWNFYMSSRTKMRWYIYFILYFLYFFFFLTAWMSGLLSKYVHVFITLEVTLLYLCLLNSSFGEGNGTPLQCSCLENPRDRGAWWAAIYGVAQSRTWLKRLSSSSSKLFVDDSLCVRGMLYFGRTFARTFGFPSVMWYLVFPLVPIHVFSTYVFTMWKVIQTFRNT